jgi:Ser/Thr protein kinase RdoA (MazF antagonist)
MLAPPMMQLKHLFDDKELSRDILSRWEHDPPGERFLEWFRISTNAVYRFAAGGRPHFLRFTPEEETSADTILAELEFIGYLRGRGYPANKPVPTTRGFPSMRTWKS